MIRALILRYHTERDPHFAQYTQSEMYKMLRGVANTFRSVADKLGVIFRRFPECAAGNPVAFEKAESRMGFILRNRGRKGADRLHIVDHLKKDLIGWFTQVKLLQNELDNDLHTVVETPEELEERYKQLNDARARILTGNCGQPYPQPDWQPVGDDFCSVSDG